MTYITEDKVVSGSGVKEKGRITRVHSYRREVVQYFLDLKLVELIAFSLHLFQDGVGGGCGGHFNTF